LIEADFMYLSRRRSGESYSGSPCHDARPPSRSSSRIDHRRVFGYLGALVVDEIHAFTGDDRG
jgi:hypothetical protein